VNGVAAHWYDLGVQLLDNSTGVLDVIKADHPNDATKCCTIMFEKWLMMKPDANWNQLVTALTNLGLNSLAANMKSHLITSNFTVTKSVVGLGNIIFQVPNNTCSNIIENSIMIVKFIYNCILVTFN